MTELSDREIAQWLDDHTVVLERAITQVQGLVGFFIADWSNTWEFAVEQIENVRVKEAPRLHAKALRRGLARADQLLERCHAKDGRERFPVHDLLGIRVLVLSLNEVAAVKRAVEELQIGGQGELYPLGNPEDFDVEDMNEAPRISGYRALHIDGSVSVREGPTDYVVPFEIQVKTIAQHAFGQHTHDEAYVPDDANVDERYALVLGLQRALAEQLNSADLLLAEIEDVSGTVRDDIARRQAGPLLSPTSVANAVREGTGLKLREREAARIADRARAAGLTSTQEFSSLIDLSGDVAAGYADEFEATRRRRPTMRELVVGLVSGLSVASVSDRGEPEPLETTSELESRLAEETPANALDQLDADADLLVSEDGPKTRQSGD
jgi:ppGpp synthetase/RelA/SpoT-type nucleotidyltranferase